MINKVINYVKDDLTSWYGLNEEVSVTISGKDVTKLFGNEERVVCLPHLTIWSDTTGNKVVLTAHPFRADQKLWNGANVIPNTKYESMLASLFHDLLYEYLELLANKLHTNVGSVRKWADKVLYCIWNDSATSGWEKFKAKAGYYVCRTFGGIFHNIGKLFLIALILYFSGCCTPDWKLVDTTNGDAVKEVIENGDK